MTIEHKKICILSGRFPVSHFRSDWNHRAYANQHGFTYINCAWPTGAKNKFWNKLHYIREYQTAFDYVFWIDDDAFFLNMAKSIEAFLPKQSSYMSACKSPSNKDIFTMFSSGQFWLKCDDVGRAFIDSTIQTDLSQVQEWWYPELGLFTGGDQDAMVYQLLTNPRFAEGYDLYDHLSFNARLMDLVDDQEMPLVLHFTGDTKTKVKDHRTAMRYLGMGPSLLPTDVEEELIGGNWNEKDKSSCLRKRFLSSLGFDTKHHGR